MQRISLFTICLFIILICWIFLSFIVGGLFSVPIPNNVIMMYMGLILVAILVHVSVEDARLSEFLRPIRETVADENKRTRRIVLVVLIPLFLSGYTYTNFAQKKLPLGDPRDAHPTPQSDILTYKEETLGIMDKVDNPYRHYAKDNPELFKSHVENGRRVYYQNCFYCHGDHLDGKGHFAAALNPLPANFQDPGIIPNYIEAFFFWRISKGGPGLPDKGTPWNSAMPIWEDHLTQEEIWDVILFLSEYTGYGYRTFGEGH